MADEEPTWEQIETYLRGNGWTGGWMTPKISKWTAQGKRVRLDVEAGVDVAIPQIAIEEGRHPADVRNDILTGKFEPQPTEAEEIIAGIGLVAINARESVQAIAAQLTTSNKNPNQSRDYLVASAHYDGVMEALADAIERHYTLAGRTPNDGMPWNVQAQKYVERLVRRRAQEAERMKARLLESL